MSDDPQQTVLQVETRGPGTYEITSHLRGFLDASSKGKTGLLTLFIRHTSASLIVQENADPEVQADLQAFFHRLVPPTDDPSMHYLTHTYEGADDMPAHIKAVLMPTSLGIPVTNGQMVLGTWQGIYLFEHRNRPHRRDIVAHFA